jgi:bile acid:Na+ symporter, BASS family
MAAGVLLGLAVPPLATLAKPLLLPTLLIPLTLALLRLDWRAIAAYRQRPWLLIAMIVWLLGISPALVYLATLPLRNLGFPAPLQEAVVLMAASSPIVSSVAIALMLRLDATLAVVGVLAATALVPFTLPVVSHALLGVDLQISVGALMLRLVAMVGGAFGAAALIRMIVAPAALAREHDLLDGITVINLVIFALAIMDGVTAFAIARPGFAATAITAAFVFNLGLQAAGYLAFRRLGARRALAVGLLSGNCNMGLILVALEGRANFEVTVFFALAQIPMYVLPALLSPAYRAVLARSAESGAPPV